MAPTRAVRMMAWLSTRWASTMPLLTVLATPSNMKAPMKFRMAAMNTAFLGERARVVTTVAMEFAESWNPFT